MEWLKFDFFKIIVSSINTPNIEFLDIRGISIFDVPDGIKYIISELKKLKFLMVGCRNQSYHLVCRQYKNFDDVLPGSNLETLAILLDKYCTQVQDCHQFPWEKVFLSFPNLKTLLIESTATHMKLNKTFILDGLDESLSKARNLRKLEIYGIDLPMDLAKRICQSKKIQEFGLFNTKVQYLQEWLLEQGNNLTCNVKFDSNLARKGLHVDEHYNKGYL